LGFSGFRAGIFVGGSSSPLGFSRCVLKGINSARAAKVLAALLDKLRSASAGGRRGQLALVKSITSGHLR
jgi:hypothetical protein